LLYLVPLFILWTKLHLINTLPGLILIYSALYLPCGYPVLVAAAPLCGGYDRGGTEGVDQALAIILLIRVASPAGNNSCHTLDHVASSGHATPQAGSCAMPRGVRHTARLSA
jgi:hypothetical protein